MTDIEYARRLEKIMQEYPDREEMLNQVDFLKHQYLMQKDSERMEVKCNGTGYCG